MKSHDFSYGGAVAGFPCRQCTVKPWKKSNASSAACSRRASSTSATTSARSSSTSTCRTQGECFYFIADYHALTTIASEPPRPTQASRRHPRDNVRDVALDYLALGLDPAKATFFRQSDVPEVTELAWILATVTGMGLLERAISYKDKVDKGIDAERRPVHLPGADGRRHPHRTARTSCRSARTRCSTWR